MTRPYGTSPTRRLRRTREEMAEIRRGIFTVLSDDHPMTVRQVFYQLVSRGAIEKTEAAYKATVCRLLVEMRRASQIPFGWIADNTRWMRKPRTYSSVEDALRSTARFYRRAVWDELAVYTEVWLEKDALAGVLMEETEVWDVPLMVTRGYPSLTYLHEAAEQIEAQAKPTYLYYFGDYDPSGVDITRFVEKGLRELAPDAEISFERVAVTPEQIEAWSLPTRPTKTSDTRSRSFSGDSVEVDAIPPVDLRALVRDRIERHVDPSRLEHLATVEDEERKILEMFADRVAGLEGRS
jgi:hypothetical protein